MRRVLDYDKTRLGQDTGWYCGPATVQTILSGRGIYLTEAEIAAQTELWRATSAGMTGTALTTSASSPQC